MSARLTLVTDGVLRQGISELITIPGLINLDFVDVRAVMAEGGSTVMSIGQAADTTVRSRPPGRRSTVRCWT